VQWLLLPLSSVLGVYILVRGGGICPDADICPGAGGGETFA